MFIFCPLSKNTYSVDLHGMSLKWTSGQTLLSFRVYLDLSNKCESLYNLAPNSILLLLLIQLDVCMSEKVGANYCNSPECWGQLLQLT